ncbi:MAG: hypothetical protein A2Z29_04695 [Chloroflexi bacterium RBG_16_56_11]|nr:MAG: hypothetical protein A2Z29_04695 [Chloroflexi bacterium RBG_16_56_11]
MAAKEIKRAVIYSRVSTDMQNPENQTPVLKEWAGRRGWTVLGVYEENASAWRDGHQSELSRLIGDAYKRRFDCVLVWALDRVSRQGALAILEFVHKLNKWGIHLYSLQESWTEAPGDLGELLFALTGWVARMESQRRSERTREGIARKRREGFRWGRPRGSHDKKIRKKRALKW